MPALSLAKRPVLELKKDADTAITAKGLYGQEANVVIVIDRSGSMESPNRLYSSGQVQNCVDRVLALSLTFDSDGKADVWAFHNRSFQVGQVGLNNNDGFVDREIARKISEGGTSYAPVMRDIVAKYGNGPKTGGFMGVGASVPKAKLPTYVLFITDGDNDDKAEAEAIVRESRGHAIFWQFVGVSNQPFTFLRKLDDLKGAGLDNADFFPFDGGPISDEELFKKLLNEFPRWVKEAKKASLLA